MDILLIGGGGNVTDAILEKLNKEGNRIYVLSGSSVKKGEYKYVFEEYSFPYESSSIKEILESVNPDVTIFMGAYDTNYDWGNAREESVRYSAGLLNILMAYSLIKCGRFIYLSSEAVFGSSCHNDISEDMSASAAGFESMVIAQGEELCQKYQSFPGLDIVILRMDHLCAVPTKKEEAVDVCSRMCVQALKTGVIEASERKKFSLLYISDAVQFLYQIVETQEHERSLYHLSSSSEITEMDLAQMIQKELGRGVTIQDNTVGEEYRIVLSNEAFFEEFHARIFNSTYAVVSAIASYVRKHKKIFLEQEDQGLWFAGRFRQTVLGVARAALPFLENMICFVPFFMLNNRATGSQYFAKLDFYLLYVLLFALVYGQQQATFSAIMAVAGYFFRQMYTRSGFEVIMDYDTYVWAAQLFIVGLAVGYLRDQLNVIRKENEEREEYLSGQVSDIQNINTSNVRIKNVLEGQLVNHNQSIGKVYEITSQLEQYAPEEVMFYAAEVIARLLESKDVAIYTVANKSYARLFSSTSAKARELGNSIRYDEMGELYESVMKREVYVNKGQTEKYPLLANGIFEGEELQLILMIWGIPWERLNLSLGNLLKVTGYLIQNAVLRANRYQKALESERFMEGTKILEKSAFTSLVKAYLTAQKKGLTECALILLPAAGEQLAAMGEKAGKLVRRSDYLGELEDGRLYVLLSNTNREGAQIVISRFREIGVEAVLQEDVVLS
ncbi:MAG: NAD(P)-dependent oxidoreductase [Lachnospiraceae bacterium]|nr:NAD(P)-dependent oxidoreductase [Lachnospiraceae bacterium]